MKLIDDALEVVRVAEKSVAGFARQAVEERDYATAVTLTNLAGELRNIIEQAHQGIGASALVVASAGADVSTAARPGEESTSHPRPVRYRPRKGEFPKFLRDESTLFKLGWSKAEKTVYEHKAPKSVLAALVKKLVAVSPKRRRFTMEHVLPLSNPNEDADVSNYQVYLCLAWLRTTGLLIQHGRQGYSIAHPSQFVSEVEFNWERIPLKQDSQL